MYIYIYTHRTCVLIDIHWYSFCCLFFFQSSSYVLFFPLFLPYCWLCPNPISLNPWSFFPRPRFRVDRITSHDTHSYDCRHISPRHWWSSHARGFKFFRFVVTKARGGDTVNGVSLGQLLLRREGMELDLADATAENPDGPAAANGDFMEISWGLNVNWGFHGI